MTNKYISQKMKLKLKLNLKNIFTIDFSKQMQKEMLIFKF